MTASGLAPRHALGAILALAGAGCGILALQLESVLGRYDTLAYILQDPAGKLALLRGALGAAGGALALLALTAMKSGRTALALGGAALLAMGLLAGPAARTWLAGSRGLEESLVYRVRGLADVGLVGGAFLLFLALLPGLLASPASALESQAARGLRACRERWLSLPASARRVGIAVLAFAATAGVGFGVLADFPNSSDENSYLTQAKIFASGRLWVEAPPHAEFFRARSLILDEARGRFFAKAFPGWAAILAVGERLGVPGIVNPLLSALTLVLFGWVAGEMLGPRGELAAVGLILATPFFLLNGASYFNHPATLLFITLFLASVLKLEQGGSARWAAAAGLAAGAALTLRPASAAALTLPFFIWLGWRWIRRGRWGMVGAAALPVLATLAVLGTYNHLMYGSPWSTGYGAYDPGDIRIGLGGDNALMTGWWLLKLCLWTVPGSVAGLYFLGRGRRLKDWFREDPLAVLMAASLLLLGLSYLLFQNKGGNEYGPRYYYDGFAFLALLMTAGWIRAPRVLEQRLPLLQARRAVALVLVSGVVLSLAGSTPLLLAHYRDKVAHNRDLYVATQRTGLASALVFLKTGSGRMPPGDLVRNALDFRSGIVYARDLGLEADRALAALYPDRVALVYSYDPYRRLSSLTSLEAEAGR